MNKTYRLYDPTCDLSDVSFKSDPVSATRELALLLLHVADISCCKMKRLTHALCMEVLTAIISALRSRFNKLRNLRNRVALSMLLSSIVKYLKFPEKRQMY